MFSQDPSHLARKNQQLQAQVSNFVTQCNCLKSKFGFYLGDLETQMTISNRQTHRIQTLEQEYKQVQRKLEE